MTVKHLTTLPSPGPPLGLFASGGYYDRYRRSCSNEPGTSLTLSRKIAALLTPRRTKLVIIALLVAGLIFGQVNDRPFADRRRDFNGLGLHTNSVHHSGLLVIIALIKASKTGKPYGSTLDDQQQA